MKLTAKGNEETFRMLEMECFLVLVSDVYILSKLIEL